ncbi:MAG: hypothetical protein FJ284_14555 [Planctomycetes bacterium]|nr:hypothetical protein [Planctomycetota bacterium]MBM4059229.1 hypothetical protein [Planctomycetota bacterium]
MLLCVLPRRPMLLAAAIAMLAAGEGRAIEMFTYFGDGSRIGLPSLEVPVEAYPGIPLRSDRLRARRRGLRTGPGAMRTGATGYARGITIRAMPAAEETVAMPTAATTVTTPTRRAPVESDTAPPAPEPEDEVTPSSPSP